MKPTLSIWWCRRDFRLSDNPALSAAITYAKKNNCTFLPLFCLDSELLQNTLSVGYPRRLFLSRILAEFKSSIPEFTISKKGPLDTFAELAETFELAIFVNDDIEPYSRQRDTAVKKLYSLSVFKDQIITHVDIKSGTGNIYSVFSPFKRAIWNDFVTSQPTKTILASDITAVAHTTPTLQHIYSSCEYSTLQRSIFADIDAKWVCTVSETQSIDLDEMFFERPTYTEWAHSEKETLARFDDFISSGKLSRYKENRDDLGLDTIDGGQTSRMSVALKWGLISPRTMVAKIKAEFDSEFDNPYSKTDNEGAVSYISELVWREFYKYVLYNFPGVLNFEFQKKYRGTITWVEDSTAIKRFTSWIQGETGYKAVDAAMKQIAATGWMHNRARMMVASILTKNLGVDWRWGQEYFREVLLDLDEASNCGGWQWASSTGSDPKPIRIFNPYLQQDRHDAKGLYVKTWLDSSYSIAEPIIEHKKAREQALERYSIAKNIQPRDF